MHVAVADVAADVADVDAVDVADVVDVDVAVVVLPVCAVFASVYVPVSCHSHPSTHA